MQRRTAAGLAAGAAALALVAGVSIVWPGLDAQETAKTDTSVWALQTGEVRRYARVNTTVGELDTVRNVSDPSQVAQTADGVYLFSDSFTRLTEIDAALPADLDDLALRDSPKTPPGTTDVATAGDFVAYRTDSGAVFVGRLSSGETTQLEPSPSEDESTADYTADAIAVDERGMLFSYSIADRSVLQYDIRASELRSVDPLETDAIAAPAISAAGDAWAVVDTTDGEVWLEGAETAISTPATASVLVSQPDPGGSAVYLADERALMRVPLDGSGVTTEEGDGSGLLGTPARPIVHDGEVFAAWLPEGGGNGRLWSSRNGPSELDYDGDELPDDLRPTFVASDDAVILNETRTGWVWTLPDGKLVESSQDWTLDERTDPDAAAERGAAAGRDRPEAPGRRARTRSACVRGAW